MDPLTWKDGKSAGYDWLSYRWCNGTYNSLTKYNTDAHRGIVDDKIVLEPADDAAHVILGGNWRMPTDAEWTELRTQCTWEWTSQNGINGRIVTGPNGNSVFLPAAGDRRGANLYLAGSYGGYWSSSLFAGYPLDAWYVYFYSDSVNRDYSGRCYGFSVRPVSE